MKAQLIIIEKSRLGLVYSQGKIRDLVMRHQIYELNEIYGGTICNILPSLNAAFITLRRAKRNGFIHLDELKGLGKNVYSCRQIMYDSKKNILTQIKKEPTGNKGPSLTTDLSLVGKYSILFPLKRSINPGRERSSEREKSYLKAIAHLLKPNNGGILIKSKMMYANILFVLIEIHVLKTKWKTILKRSKKIKMPTLISRKKDFVIKIIEQTYNSTINYIGIDSKKGAMQIYTLLKKLKKTKELLIEYYSKSKLLIREYCVDLTIHKYMIPKININRGAYIIIEKTEALTTIDVNSGSFIRSPNSRETSFWTNYAAVNEIVSQIKIRNIGGIIILDFIGSNNHEDQMKILSHLSRLLKQDTVPCNIIQMSELGLVEVTRSRRGQNIYDAFSSRCDVCNGIGYLTTLAQHKSSKPYELFNQLIPLFSDVIMNKERYNLKQHKESM